MMRNKRNIKFISRNLTSLFLSLLIWLWLTVTWYLSLLVSQMNEFVKKARKSMNMIKTDTFYCSSTIKIWEKKDDLVSLFCCMKSLLFHIFSGLVKSFGHFKVNSFVNRRGFFFSSLFQSCCRSARRCKYLIIFM